MKRFHVHVAVENLGDSIIFYSDLFGAKPAVERADYAKWMLEDPRLNFAISSRGHKPGINHLGFQADDELELAQLGERADHASGSKVLAEKEVACCYAKGNKYWVVDPQGLAWEHFHTLGEIPIFGEETTMKELAAKQACCIPLHESKTPTEEASKGACCVPNAAADAAQAQKSSCC
ncbi:MAG: ArsI/CadI family heavy metal resistance metalloenzyme [Candidatus Binatus sp.]|uniref:ArsI/CadI family heavy metal resistance metalloenzyme n=1 Tax=Candidatus Binatus sp. TaxID=2811406 RepID=UPI002724CB94|nr:ArsI/CadI family heavy metal resistance metalloenzyme [Candidatus Binatus sp.]MDO8434517.1 ArsI/CadI family heavy metal resistance metalloenzyme [Candidatus Binatus sp.]